MYTVKILPDYIWKGDHGDCHPIAYIVRIFLLIVFQGSLNFWFQGVCHRMTSRGLFAISLCLWKHHYECHWTWSICCWASVAHHLQTCGRLNWIFMGNCMHTHNTIIQMTNLWRPFTGANRKFSSVHLEVFFECICRPYILIKSRAFLDAPGLRRVVEAASKTWPLYNGDIHAFLI